jgi:hypothetical protein
VEMMMCPHELTISRTPAFALIRKQTRQHTHTHTHTHTHNAVDRFQPLIIKEMNDQIQEFLQVLGLEFRV